MSNQTNYLYQENKHLLEKISCLESLLKEEKQTSDEYYEKYELINLENDFLNDTVLRLKSIIKYQKRKKIEARQLIKRLKISLDKALNYNNTLENLLVENNFLN